MPKVAWDDDKVGNKDKLVFRANEWARICVIDTEAEHEFTHYLDRKEYPEGGSFICTQESGVCHLHDKADLREHFAALVVLYRSDSAGSPLMPVQFQILPWVFGVDKYRMLKMFKIQAGDLRQRDILVYCTDQQYQKIQLTLDPSNQPAMWLRDEELKKAVAAEFKQKKATMNLVRIIGRRLSPDEQLRVVSRVPGGQPSARSMTTSAFGGSLPPTQPPVKDGFGMGSKDVDALLGGGGPASPPQQELLPPNSAPAQAPSAALPAQGAPAAEEPPVDLDAMLKDLG